jgi:rare lipoprotein A
MILAVMTLSILSTSHAVTFEQTGLASWYGPGFHGKLTANGERFNMMDMTAAHKTLPLNSIVKVTSLENQKSILVRINDRGPFIAGRIIDLSRKAALELGLVKSGTMPVSVTLIEKGDNAYHRYSSRLYSIQIASFSDRQRADELAQNLAGQNIETEIKGAWVSKRVWRVIIPGINYSELQLLRIQLHNAGVSTYLVKTSR